MNLSNGKTQTDERAIEETLGSLLRIGVVIAAGTVLLGGVLNLLRHGNESMNWEKFHGEPAALRTLSGIADAALAAQGKGIIQFGLLVLVAIPVLRVAVSVLTFVQKRDFVFAAFTFFVLMVLFFSLFMAS